MALSTDQIVSPPNGSITAEKTRHQIRQISLDHPASPSRFLCDPESLGRN